MSRPKLLKNATLAELKKTELLAAPAHHCYAGAEDVACDVCTGRKLKALKSCLVCVASYCEEHLQPHHQSAPFKRHELVEPSKNLQENICLLHGNTMDLFCRTDQQYICSLCYVDQHKDHDTVSAAAQRTQKQRKLDPSGEEVQQRSQDIDRDVKVLSQEEEAPMTIDVLQKRRSDVKQQMRSKMENEVRRVRDAEERFQQELTELKREAELRQLSVTPNHSQSPYRSQSGLTPSAHSSNINICPLRHFEGVRAAVAAFFLNSFCVIITVVLLCFIAYAQLSPK